MNMNNNNNTIDDSSVESSDDDSTKPSPIRSIGVTVKLEKDVSAPNVTSIVHKSSVEGSDSTAVTGSSNANPLVIPSSPSSTTPEPSTHRPYCSGISSPYPGPRCLKKTPSSPGHLFRLR
mmetsp:Transcript_11347/g.12852  ORF Transcript_11347/g.12852 Transcript_11347/m.12852 type:complete len:120 (+) Transcript_11347:294-653(+)